MTNQGKHRVAHKPCERLASVIQVEMASAGQNSSAKCDNSVILGVVVVDFVRYTHAHVCRITLWDRKLNMHIHGSLNRMKNLEHSFRSWHCPMVVIWYVCVH